MVPEQQVFAPTKDELILAFEVISRLKYVVIEILNPVFQVSAENIVYEGVDNSLSIYVDNSRYPYPMEPHKDLRIRLYGLGISKIYWYFVDGCHKIHDWIRDTNPRRSFYGNMVFRDEIGYVDSRFTPEIESMWRRDYAIGFMLKK